MDNQNTQETQGQPASENTITETHEMTQEEIAADLENALIYPETQGKWYVGWDGLGTKMAVYSENCPVTSDWNGGQYKVWALNGHFFMGLTGPFDTEEQANGWIENADAEQTDEEIQADNERLIEEMGLVEPEQTINSLYHRYVPGYCARCGGDCMHDENGEIPSLRQPFDIHAHNPHKPGTHKSYAWVRNFIENARAAGQYYIIPDWIWKANWYEMRENAKRVTARRRKYNATMARKSAEHRVHKAIQYAGTPKWGLLMRDACLKHAEMYYHQNNTELALRNIQEAAGYAPVTGKMLHDVFSYRY